MPEEEIKKRGGAKRYRTISLPGGKYIHVAVVRKAGKKGGHTIAGPVRKKKELRWTDSRREADRKLREMGYD